MAGIDDEVDKLFEFYGIVEDTKDGWYPETIHEFKESVLQLLTAQKQAIQSLIEREVRNAQSEILQGFRRRDFVREDIYRTAVTDRLAELNQTNKRSE